MLKKTTNVVSKKMNADLQSASQHFIKLKNEHFHITAKTYRLYQHDETPCAKTAQGVFISLFFEFI